jgi:ABC-type uncharacterized transport system, permease component
MFTPSRLEDIGSDSKPIDYLGIFTLKLGGIVELLIIFLFWLLLFSQYQEIFNLTREEVITYILVGNIIGMAASFVWARIITRDLKNTDSKFLVFRPYRYLRHILKRAFLKFFPTFLFVVLLNLLLLQTFVGAFPENPGPLTLAVILLMVILAFFIEFLIAYLFQLFVFWTIESADIYRLLIRTKKLLSGAYFPLTLLPLAFLQASLFLPFAYSFFIPTQLYLDKLPIEYGLFGLSVQLVWILVLYLVIKLAWKRKNKSFPAV